MHTGTRSVGEEGECPVFMLCFAVIVVSSPASAVGSFAFASFTQPLDVPPWGGQLCPAVRVMQLLLHVVVFVLGIRASRGERDGRNPSLWFCIMVRSLFAAVALHGNSPLASPASRGESRYQIRRDYKGQELRRGGRGAQEASSAGTHTNQTGTAHDCRPAHRRRAPPAPGHCRALRRPLHLHTLLGFREPRASAAGDLRRRLERRTWPSCSSAPISSPSSGPP